MSCTIADTPARQLATGSAGHTAKHGCNFCNQIGCTLNHRMVVSDIEKEPRTNENFRLELDLVKSTINIHTKEFSRKPRNMLKELAHFKAVGICNII